VRGESGSFKGGAREDGGNSKASDKDEGRWVEELARRILVQLRVSVSKNHHINCHENPVNCESVVIREDKSDRRHPEVDALAFSYDAGDVLSLDGCV